MKRTPFKRVSKQPLSILKIECDKFLTPIVKKKHPLCEACKIAQTFVAHHWVEKSRSNRLRYDIENLIALCNSCHFKIHNQFGNRIANQEDTKKLITDSHEIGWNEKMEKIGREYIKVDRQYYEEVKLRLQNEVNN